MNKGLLFLIFLGSALLRIPLLDRPLSRHHESLTAHTLKPLQIWHEAGAWRYRFSPIITYPNPGDKYVKDEASSMMDPKGDHYYLSTPPFAYIFPYFVFKLLGIVPGILPIQIFNLFLHGINCLIVFLVLNCLFRKGSSDGMSIAFIGFAIYLFSPVTLWYHGNAYFVETCVQTFFWMGIFLFLKWHEKFRPPLQWTLFMGINLFFMIYTNLLGLFFAFGMILLALFKGKESRYRVLLLSLLLSSLFSLSLVLWQYSQIDGLQNLLGHWSATFLRRSPFKTFPPLLVQPQAWGKIGFYHAAGNLPFLLFLFVLFVLLCKKQKNLHLFLAREEKILLFLTGVPPLLHDLVFFDATLHHDFFMMKFMGFYILLTAIVYRRLSPFFTRRLIPTIFLGSVLLSVVQFWTINQRPDPRFKTIGEKIGALAKPDEVVFLKPATFYAYAQMIVYAKRNIAHWETRDQAIALLQRNGLKKGIIFQLNEQENDIQSVSTFSLDEAYAP